MSVANFLEYATEGFYPGHHLPPRGQGLRRPGRRLHGDDGREGRPGPPIQNEATNGLSNVRGTRRDGADSQSLRSATSQFYFNVSSNPDLDHTGFSPRDFGYAVFGRVLVGHGRRRPHRQRSRPHPSAGMDDVPVDPVRITGVKVVR